MSSDATFFATPDEFRAWLEEHHATEKELLVGYHKVGTGRASMTWAESVDQALCFGWIDGVRRRIDDGSYSIRFTPRKPGSTWSAVNVARVAELSGLGLMRRAGLRAFEARQAAKTAIYAYEQGAVELDPGYEQRLRDDPQAWEFWQAQPPSYRKPATWWVMSAKQEETRQRRLAMLIEDSANRRRIASLSRRPRE